MLKHLKLKAAKLQDQSPDLHDGETLSCPETEIVEQSRTDGDLANQRTQENFIHSTTLPYTKELETAKSLCDTGSKDTTANSSGTIPGSAVMSVCHAQTSTSHGADQYLPDEICHMKFRTPPHGSNMHAVHNAYKSICQDPNCHCSPAKLLTRHSPNMEGNCSCLSCLHQANLPRVVHHNSSVPYLHPNSVVESSAHLHPPGSGVFYSPQHSYLPQKPFFQSPYDHEWSRFTNPTYSAPNMNHAFSNAFHSYSPKKLPSPLWSSPNKQEYRLGVGQNLTLPLARSTIVSLLKRGRCDSLLRLLDGPLHDESSPLYPVALNTVLEILDVVEKEFATAYTNDRKIKGDIHHLANFVKGMTNASVSPSQEENVANRGGDINSDSLLVKGKLGDGRSPAKTYKSPAVTKKDEGLVYETADVSNSVVVPPKTPALGTDVTPSVPIKTISTIENTREGTTVTESDQNGEESRSDGMSTGDRLGVNRCEPKVISIGGDEKKSLEEKTKVEKIPENLSNFERNNIEKDTPSGCSSINCKDDEQNASVEGEKGSDATKNASESHMEKVEKEESKSVLISKDSERPMPVLENELELQKLFVGGQSKNTIEERPLDSDIDALLDQSLMEADQAKAKVFHKMDSNKTPEDPSTSGPSDYRGKGYKVRAVSSSDKQVGKVKAPVKTFAQIREKQSPLICGSQLDHDTKLKADQKPVSVADSVTMSTTDLNGNIVEGNKTSAEGKISNETSGVNTDSALREGTPELGRCPSNPLSPSCSDSLDSTDFKSFLEKSRGRTSIGSVSNENDANGVRNISSNSALSLLDHMKKLPLPKEPIKQGGSGKPLISKSFHGKLLLQKHSKDDPYPIPLEITDSDFTPRDPRLSLSNLMESKVNYEFSLLQWEDNQTASPKLGPMITDFPLNHSAINVRDPRIRRRLSEDRPLPVLNGSAPLSLVGMSVLTPNLPNVQISSTTDKSKTNGQCVTEIVEGNACNVLESENSSIMSKDVSPPETIPGKDSTSSALNGKDISPQLDISNSESSLRKTAQNCVEGNVTLSDADTSLSKKILDNSNGDQVAQNTSADSFEQELVKSAIHSIRKTGDIGQLKKKEIPGIASTVSSCNISEIDKMDTVVSFREALDVLKGIKSELKNDLEKCGSKIEKIGKDKIAKLCSKVKLLRQTCEVGLLSTEVQRKKASGTRLRDLSGLLEDHFILVADLTILGVWLKTWNTDVRDCREGLPEFKKGVFTRRTVPCFKKLEKWLKNRYKLDGFENEKLLKLVSLISQSGDGKRSRSRSSSTGSSKHKRKKARTASKDDDKNKKKHNKKSDHGKDPSGVESPVKEQTKRSHSPSNRNCGPNSKRSKDDKLYEENVKPDTPGVATSSDSDTSNETPEPSPSTNSGSRTPVSEAESPPSQEVKKNASKQKVHANTDSQFQKTRKSEGSSQKKQSVSVNSGIQDIQEDMERIKKSVLSVFRKRSASSANRSLGELTEISHKAHTQLEDENKTYTSLKNVSKDTKAKFHDVIKGIQRIIVDCEILVYSLSSSASKVTARETKDKIWENAQKSSHKPSYEEELALLLSLRKTYLHSDLWRYIKTDVDDRIDSLQKKCRSRDIGSQKCASSSMDYASVERPNSWMTATVMPCEQVITETRLETPLTIPVADYDRRHEVGFHGPGAPLNIDYHGSYLAATDRNNLRELPNDIYTPPSNRPFVRDGYHPNGTGVPREPYQPMTSFLPRDDHMKYDWRRKYDDEYDTWPIVRRNPLTTDIDYGGRRFTPPPAI